MHSDLKHFHPKRCECFKNNTNCKLNLTENTFQMKALFQVGNCFLFKNIFKLFVSIDEYCLLGLDYTRQETSMLAHFKSRHLRNRAHDRDGKIAIFRGATELTRFPAKLCCFRRRIVFYLAWKLFDFVPMQTRRSLSESHL